MTTVAIIGLGLIGSSLSLALQREQRVMIIGFDRSYKTTDEAYRRSMIDVIAPNARYAAERADVVIFATPVNTTVRLLEEAIDQEWAFREGAIVTDTGSTKVPIMKAARPLIDRGMTFIGGHPMAGSHKSGIQAAQELLFENAYYILTPDEATRDEAALNTLRDVLSPTKGKYVVLSAEEHDRMTAVVSHFPHVIASSLVDQLAFEEEEQPFVAKLAAGGFRDLTRIASADPVMWRDVTLQNRDELLRLFDRWHRKMDEVYEIIKRNDPEEVLSFFKEAKQYRDDLPSTYKGATQGALYMTFDLHIDIPDHPGSIAEVTQILADERISLTNIRIVETRTDVYGILVISFQKAEDRKRARDILEERTDYSMHII